jgi:predicted alpha/beta hydrolase family esterase
MLPGIYDSGPTHWQTLWEQQDRRFVRFRPDDWDRPVLDDWIGALDRAVSAAPEPPVLVGHSLACLLVPMWASRAHAPVAGAFLVAPPDPLNAQFPAAAHEFADPVRQPLGFPALLIGSSDDHYADAGFAEAFAADIGAEYFLAGSLGHINADSGLGDWGQGKDLFAAFCAGLRDS